MNYIIGLSFIYKLTKSQLYNNLQCFAASDLALQCLYMSHKKDARLVFRLNDLRYKPEKLL